MNEVIPVLEKLGYGEIRLEESAPNGSPQESEDGGEWAPLSDMNGRFGTTDRTKIISRKNRPTCRLVDRETGELVATARKSCSTD